MELFYFSVQILKQFTNAMMSSKKYIFGWLHNEFCFVHCSNLLYIAASLQLHICNRLLLIPIQQEQGNSLIARKLHTEQENSVTPVCPFENPDVIWKGCTFSVAGVHVLSSKCLFGQEKKEGSIVIKIFCKF